MLLLNPGQQEEELTEFEKMILNISNLPIISTPFQGRTVKVALKKTSGEIWVETEPLPVLCTMAHIVFNVARVDRRDSLVPYLIYDTRVQPYWKSLIQFPAVQNGCQALEMTVVLQPKEIPITTLFDKVRPLHEDETYMSYETFKNCLTDPLDKRYMDMEFLMNTVYPVEKVNEIWTWHTYTLCSNLYPVEAYPVDAVDGDS